MIHSSFALTPKETKIFEDLKASVAYREYVKSILESPIFMKVAQENLNDIDIKQDIELLMEEAKHTPTELNKLFKKALSKMAIGIVADTVILQELSAVKIDEVRDTLSEDFKISYLLGLAEDKYYKQAENKLKIDPDKNSVLYRGLIEFYKRTGSLEEHKDEFELMTDKVVAKSDKIIKKTPAKEISIEGSDIRI